MSVSQRDGPGQFQVGLAAMLVAFFRCSSRGLLARTIADYRADFERTGAECNAPRLEDAHAN